MREAKVDYNQLRRAMERHSLFGSIAGFTSAVTLQPLQNIKMVLLVPPKDLVLTNNFFKNVVRTAQYLYRDDGYRAFYRGLAASVLRTAFSSAFFFSILRSCQRFSKQHEESLNPKLANFLSSLTARTISNFLSNPLSVIETRYEYGGKGRWQGGILGSLRKIYMVEGIAGFWKGALAATYKEGIFAGTYYTLYQEGKILGLNAFVAGMLAGMVSTALTHPFEIVRAEIQSYILTNNQSAVSSIGRQVQVLFKTGEAFRGLAPRVIKKPLNNTMAFLLFEMMERIDSE